jgi:hypothetical protein
MGILWRRRWWWWRSAHGRAIVDGC